MQDFPDRGRKWKMTPERFESNYEQGMTIQKITKGRVSNSVAWIFIFLQVLFTLGGLSAGHSPHGGKNVSLQNAQAMVQSAVFLFCMNLLVIGALILGLIVWLYHGNQKGRDTTIVSIVAIIVNTLSVIW
jgi:hypothetical protein